VEPNQYPVTFSVDYPDRDLDRLTTFFRIFMMIPIAILAGALAHSNFGGAGYYDLAYYAGAAIGLIGLPAGLMILFREKYPRWWFDFNLELMRFTARISIYGGLMTDQYPSTDEQQSVRLDFPYPDVENDLNRGMPIVKWLLAIPHYIVLFFLYIGVFFALIAAWFTILFTGRYPRGIFDFVEGVYRWHFRVLGYAFALVTDRYPPFSLKP
jgi:hypothetical protein